ncbi:kinetochore protein spc24 [Mollisia scopiformis]|uniref:Kinetochore protein Spc24 n=1 Tax=Mollisia scopiformis TaxID=149040 RepID=A0A194X9G5_MOLSC|nr:kinetochore protein spc24 [Mollisia scopiformis]KUJ16815.1 kinetochore protein spc24 [Mollisia scopiformis]
MLLDESPAFLIHETIGNFNTQPDKLVLCRINDSLSRLNEGREKRVMKAESSLKRLARTLTTLNNHHLETLSSHSSTAHASEIATLDTQKFRIAKTANDLEIESERLSSQLADLQARLQELELQGVDGGDNARRGLVDDELTLRLKLYRGLGIDLEKDTESGEYTKAIIRNEKKGDVNVVNLDNKFSRYFYANYFWQQL